jgi:hypothetical protein
LPLALLAAGPILAAPLSGALEGDVSAGYDSNPAQSHEATGLAFARYVFAAVQPIGLGGADVSRGASSFYTELRGGQRQLPLRAERRLVWYISLQSIRTATEHQRPILIQYNRRGRMARLLAGPPKGYSVPASRKLKYPARLKMM